MINKRHLSILNQIKESGGEIDNEKPNDSVMLIDGMNLFIRVFSVGSIRAFHTPDGQHHFLVDAIRRLNLLQPPTLSTQSLFSVLNPFVGHGGIKIVPN